MSGDPLSRVGELLEQALALAPAGRGEFLDEACAGDAALRAEVESLIASHEQAGSRFLNEPWRASSSTPGSATQQTESAGRIGPYLLTTRIGTGGMGEVFAAVRADGQFEQTVALKLVRAGYAHAGDVAERFRAERQILAPLDHPNIARLLDGGTANNGAPYIVMELVDGVPIDEYCRSRSLSIGDRLQLFLQVCSAVQYAHQRLVIHRDIKPANILVTAEGTPKLLDFGIAKVLDPIGGAQETLLRPFTPEYASPEQVRGEPVSTASDVYALGVVLYHLLTGHSPYRIAQPTSGALADAITGQESERPSAIATASARQLRGDLDAIVLKALRKEPDARYSSVDLFADDIRRHLDGRPVTARKGSWTYLAGRFVRRHRAVVAAAALILVTLVAGIIVTAREARIADANRRRADARFNDVRKLANSLLFEVHDSIATLPGATDARQLILQRSLEYLDSLAKESTNEPDLVRELAVAYERVANLQGSGFHLGIGDLKTAAASFEKSLALREGLARANPQSRSDRVDLAGAYTSYGEFQSSGGNVRRGFEYEERALAILDREAQLAPADERIAARLRECLITRAMMQTDNGLMAAVGTPAQGIADLNRALRLAQRMTPSPSDADPRERVGAIEALLAQAWMSVGDRPEAIVHFRRALDVLEPLVRAGNQAVAAYNSAVDYGRIGDALLIDDRIAEALPYYQASLRAASSLAARDLHNESVHQQEDIALVETGHAMVELGRVDEGLTYIRRALAKIEADRSDLTINRAIEALIRGWFGEALERQGNVREASNQYALTKTTLGVLRAKGVNDARMAGYYAAALDRLGASYVKLGEIDKAVREYDEARSVLEPLVAANPANLELTYAVAEAYTGEGTIAAARAARGRTRDERLADWREASRWYRKSLDAWSRVGHPSRISNIGLEVTIPAGVTSRLAQSDRQVAVLTR